MTMKTAKNPLTAEERQHLRDLLAKVAETQQEFWDALRDFEQEAGIDLNSYDEFVDYTEPTDEDLDYVLGEYPESEE